MDISDKAAHEPARSSPRTDVVPAAVRSAVGWLLTEPGAMSEAERSKILQNIEAKTIESLQALHEILFHKFQYALGAAAEDWIVAKMDPTPPVPRNTMRERASRLFNSALSRGLDPAVLLLHLEAYQADSFRAPQDIRREARAFNKTHNSTPEHTRELVCDGMVGPQIQAMGEHMAEMFRVLENQGEEDALSVLQRMNAAQLSPEITATLRSPRSLYERLIMEKTALSVQSLRYDQWSKAFAAGTEIDAATMMKEIEEDPKAYVRRLLGALHDIPRPELLTPFFRKRVTTGAPLYDVPVALVMKLSPGHRTLLVNACSNWSEGTAEDRELCIGISKSLEKLSTAEPENMRSVLTPDPMLLLNVAYESQQGPAKQTDQAANGTKKTRKWAEYTIMLGKRDMAVIDAALSACGFVPDALYRSSGTTLSKSFQQDMSFRVATDVHAHLVQQGTHMKDPDIKRLLNARAQLLDALLSGPQLTQAGGSISIDPRGLYLRLERQRSGKESHGVLAAHLPYRYVSDVACAQMLREGRLSESNAREVRVNRASEMGDHDELVRINREKAEEVLRALGEQSDDPEAHIREILADPTQHDRLFRAVQPGRGGVIHMPSSLVTELLVRHRDQPVRERVESLMRAAARMQASMVKFDPGDTRYYELQKVIIEPLLIHMPRGVEYLWRKDEAHGRVRLGIDIKEGLPVSVLLDQERLGAYQELLARLPHKD